MHILSLPESNDPLLLMCWTRLDWLFKLIVFNKVTNYSVHCFLEELSLVVNRMIIWRPWRTNYAVESTTVRNQVFFWYRGRTAYISRVKCILMGYSFFNTRCNPFWRGKYYTFPSHWLLLYCTLIIVMLHSTILSPTPTTFESQEKMSNNRNSSFNTCTSLINNGCSKRQIKVICLIVNGENVLKIKVCTVNVKLSCC